MPQQLAMPVRPDDDALFANFSVTPVTAAAVARLRLFLDSRNGSLVLHGPSGSGKSHLLHACHNHIESAGGEPIYLPLGVLREQPVRELFDALEQRALICLDDIDALAGDHVAEEALFDLFNRCAEHTTALLMSARQPPDQSGFRLADLVSRLNGGLMIALTELDDEGRMNALQLRARHRGMIMDGDVARFIWQRSTRDMSSLIAVLDRLDTASLEAGRKLSIPFVKSAMAW